MLQVECCCGNQTAITRGDQRHDEPVFVVEGPVRGTVHGGATGAGESGPLGDDLVPEHRLVRVEGEVGGREQERVLSVVERAEGSPREYVAALCGVAALSFSNA